MLSRRGEVDLTPPNVQETVKVLPRWPCALGSWLIESQTTNLRRRRTCVRGIAGAS